MFKITFRNQYTGRKIETWTTEKTFAEAVAAAYDCLAVGNTVAFVSHKNDIIAILDVETAISCL